MKKIFNIPIYDCTINVYLDIPAEDAVKQIEKSIKQAVDTDKDFTTDNIEGFVIGDKNKIYVWLRKNASRQTVLHEAFHVFEFVCDYISMNMKDSEVNARLLAYITETLLRIADKHLWIEKENEQN